MKVIDLLNKIANDEQPPKKIMYDSKIWEYREYDGEASDGTIWTSIEYRNIENGDELFDEYVITGILNDKVEILETTITYKQDDYIQCQPYTGEVEIKCNSAKNLWESDKTYKHDKIEYLNIEKDRYNAEKISCKINEIIEVLNER